MTPLRTRMLEDMRIRNFSELTIKSYVYEVSRFAKYHDTSPEKLGADEIRAYLLHVVDERKLSKSSYGKISSALRFLYTVTLDQRWMVRYIPIPQKIKKLPVVLTPAEVKEVISRVPSSRDRAIICALYGTGVRVSELTALKLKDIDSTRMVIRVQCGKGNRERQTLLSESLLKALRQYWSEYRPKEYLFSSRQGGGPLDTSTIRQICRKAGRRVGIRFTPHLLRHTFASTLLEMGVDLLTLQLLLGHSSIRTTATYLHVSTRHISGTPSPLDLIAPEVQE